MDLYMNLKKRVNHYGVSYQIFEASELLVRGIE